MAYELRQEIKLTQNLVMTPQLQQAIKLLQLSRLELVETIKEEVETNPVLEETMATESPDQSPSPEQEKPEIDWQSYLEQADTKPFGVNFNDRDGQEENDLVGNISSPAGSLTDHLRWQLTMAGLDNGASETGEYIIGNIDSDGYLRAIERGPMTDDEYEAATLEEICAHTGRSPDEALNVLSLVQHFDPLGAGSRTLRECLLVQAWALPVRDTLVEEIIASHLEDLGRKDFRKIARALGAGVEEVVEAARTIEKTLNPTPGSGYGSEPANAVIPDVFINKVGDEYVITLNEDGLPKLKISAYYRKLLSDPEGALGGEAKGYIQDKLRGALWLIKSVHQRQRTIYRVVECIVKFQKDFLDKGLKYLKPMVLKDVASEIEVHESTVSRVTSNKYVQTPRGIFELKYFFSTGLSGSDGEDVAVEYIKERIQEIIKGEDPKKPYSDQQIVELLKQSGIKLARRTAAKYREALGVLPSSRRKVRY